jgi:hypothetical protein
MPHIIRKVANGYYVSDAKKMANGRYKNYSKEPLTYDEAHKQYVAINLSLIRKGESPAKVWQKKK